MKLLRKRGFAAILMVLLVLLALFAGTIRSAFAARTRTNDVFFEPEDGYGNLNESFVVLTDHAKTLYSLGKEYKVGSAQEYKSLIDTVRKAKMPAEKLYAAQRLQHDTESFFTELSQQNLDSVDTDSANRAMTRLNIEGQRIEQIVRVRKASFNTAAEEYNTEVLESPMTGWLLKLLGFSEIEKIY